MIKSEFSLVNEKKSLEELIFSYKEKYGSLKVDLGCGHSKPKTYIGLDNYIGIGSQKIIKEQGPDIIINLDHEKLPFEDDTIDEIRSSHFLEHSHLDHIFRESYRVLKADGIFEFTIPYANSAEGMYPGHHIFLTERFFYENFLFNDLFEILSEEYRPSKDWEDSMLKNFIPFNEGRKFLFNVCNEMKMICRVKK